MTPERLQQLIDKFASRRIAVIGDFFLDKYLDVDPTLVETSVETGKHANQVVSIRRSAGAAGTVVNNLAALGTGTLHAVGAVGDDGEGYELLRCLREVGCTTDRLLQFAELMTPTYLKPRDMTNPGLAGEHERYDTKNRRPTPPHIIDSVLQAFETILPEVDAVIIADQVEQDDCGIITAAARAALAQHAAERRNVFFCADSRTHIHQFRNAIIKPNQFEATGLANPLPGTEVSLASITRAIVELRERNNAPVLVTLGDRGILVSDPDPTLIAGVTVTGELDTTGAGDSATAGMMLGLACGADLAEAALLGNLVASITIQQLATTGTATPAQVVERHALWMQQQGPA